MTVEEYALKINIEPERLLNILKINNININGLNDILNNDLIILLNDFFINIDDIDYSYVFNLSSNKEMVYEIPSPPDTYVEKSNLLLFFVGLYFYKKLIVYIEGRLNK